jgi:bifunctional DNA-binding transcriptional regulator/antitoxin component of YhaV-PrlF toxin-antitoxin module
MSVWQSNLTVLRSASDKQMAQRTQFDAKVNGDAVEIDDNGRVLIPASTRKLLGINGKDQVWLDAFNGRVNMVTKRVFEERMRESDENRAADLAALDELANFR